jgi:hypothetical protein
MVQSIHEVARHTKTHIKYNNLISGSPLALEVPDTATFTVSISNGSVFLMRTFQVSSL